VLTRVPLLDFGVRAYVDIPYIALVLAALLAETRRPRAGWPVLAILAVAGLLRPEAWLFSLAYLVYLWWPIRRRERPALGLVALAVSAPIAWALSDLAFAGDALYSLTGTQDTVETLGRETGLGGLITEAPPRLGEVVREPVLVGAVVGVVLAFALLRRRSALPLAFGTLAVGAFSLLALGGLAVITRYLLLVGVVVSIFCAVSVFGWLLLDRASPWRVRWMVGAGIVALLLLAFVPAQANRIDDLQGKIAEQDRIQSDLHELADSDAFEPNRAECGPVSVPNTRPVPMLALWLDRRPSGILSREIPPRGYFVEPASSRVDRGFRLDPNDPGLRPGPVPPRFTEIEHNGSWELYARC
jgi:hypothetical protein